ncbi:hypothetical protein BCV70DRAFT_234693 [Testicularia cyperi]|uniref:SnoaL-like domain-containing protein n=1 Tax=Testicularia cyperi TaxID=1882483 RepID=A0A317XYR9_9BASI|nr:hypothetical protein BCV70DRAFT_234693 [Testicularia cyperi]
MRRPYDDETDSPDRDLHDLIGSMTDEMEHNSNDSSKVSPSSDVPAAIADFVKRFYELSDTPDVHQQYVECFIADEQRLSFQIGPMQPTNQPSGILAWRETGWQGVTRRKHVVHAVFLSPERDNDIMLDGYVEIDKNGATLKFNWAGRMVFDESSVENGQPVIETYKVWLSQA